MRNQVVWITGASGGIGEAMINELGAKLVVSSRNSEALYTLRTIVKIVLLTFMYCSPTRKAEKALAKGKLIQEGEPGRECQLMSPVGDEIGWLSASNRKPADK